MNNQLRGELLNMYGPTETTVWSATHVVRTGDTRVPIGRPVANTAMYVVDESGEVVPAGVAGELLIGGDGVVRGYLGRPALTAERFVPDGFGTVPGRRLYRTGDLARWLPDGTLEFVGRIDHQVKIRGFRIELGEVEARLSTHGSVGEAVVTVREDVPGEKRLVAYVTPQDGAAHPVAIVLREHLKVTLPEHMVPSAWVVLDKLPRTLNHKVNRNALPPPDMMAAADSYVAPRNAQEELLAGLFAEILGVSRVGIHE